MLLCLSLMAVLYSKRQTRLADVIEKAIKNRNREAVTAALGAGLNSGPIPMTKGDLLYGTGTERDHPSFNLDESGY